NKAFRAGNDSSRNVADDERSRLSNGRGKASSSGRSLAVAKREGTGGACWLTSHALPRMGRALDGPDSRRYTRRHPRGNSSVVEHRLAKARVEGSNPFSRSRNAQRSLGFFVCALLIDA